MSFHPEFEPNYIPPVDVSTPEERELSQWKKKAEGIISGERSWYQYEGIQGDVFIDCLNLKDINAEKAWKRDTVSPDKMAGLEGINITTDPVPQKIDEGFLRGMLKDKEFMATLINKREVEGILDQITKIKDKKTFEDIEMQTQEALEKQGQNTIDIAA